MARTLHWLVVEGDQVAERRSAPEGWETVGFVEEAAYLHRSGRAWWARLFGAKPRLTLRAPFDAAGNDALSLFGDEASEPLEPDGSVLQVVGHAAGRVVCLSPREPGDEVVLRDLWLERARVLDAVQFGLEPRAGPPVAVGFVQMPLVVGVPREASVGEFFEAPHTPRAPPALSGLPRGATGQLVELREGDEVEVVGLTWDPERCERRFNLAGRTASYRSVASALRLVLGDAPGLRMVIRKVGKRTDL